LLAPGIRVLYAAHGFALSIARFAACILPPFRLSSEKEFKTGTRYNKKEELLSDKLIYNDGLIISSGIAVVKGIEEIGAQFNQLTTPYILFQGGVDKFVDPFAPLELE
jgi:hypothetical protein